jgi:hypothetical protein
VPAISARALGAYRALLGAALFLIVVSQRIDAVPFDGQRVYSPLAAAPWVRALAADQVATMAVHVGALSAATAFALGVLPRTSYALLVALVALRTLFVLLQAGAHDWGTPLLTLLGLLVVPWNEAPPLLAHLRGRRAAPDASAADVSSPYRSWRYGFAVWLPGLTIGLAFAAAALEKLRRSGIEWVTTGAVRYHFVEDAANAPFELGLWIATRPELSVLLSFGGLLVEAAFIAVVFIARWRGRLALGTAAAALMAGFFVFQGIHWWPWLMLLTAFLPWNRGTGARESAADRRLSPVHAGIVMCLVAGQAWASYRRVEIEPLLSHYPMYSSTYESPEHYEHAHAEMRFHAGGQDVTARVRQAGGGGPISRALEASPKERQLDPAIREALDEFRARYEGMHGEVPVALDVFERSRPFDWEQGHFNPERVRPLGRIEFAPPPRP